MITGQFNSWPIVLMPTSPGFRNVDWDATSLIGEDVSPYTQALQVQDWQQDVLSASVELPPMTRQQAQQWIAFRLQLRGSLGVFMLGDALQSAPLGVATGTPVTVGTSQSGYSLNTNGWTPSVTGILQPGDYIQLGFRLYRCLDVVNSDVSGNASFNIFPSLRESPPAGTSVITRNAQGMFRLADNSSKWSASYLTTYGMTFQIREAL
jgi:hypothetical protein